MKTFGANDDGMLVDDSDSEFRASNIIEISMAAIKTLREIIKLHQLIELKFQVDIQSKKIVTVFNGKPFAEDKTMNYYQLKEGDKINLLLKPCINTSINKKGDITNSLKNFNLNILRRDSLLEAACSCDFVTLTAEPSEDHLDIYGNDNKSCAHI